MRARRASLSAVACAAILAIGSAATAQVPPAAPSEAPATNAPPPGFTNVTPLGETPERLPVLTFQPAAHDFRLISFAVDGVLVTQLVTVEGGLYRYQTIANLSGGDHVASVEYVGGGSSSSAAWSFRTALPPPRPEAAFGWSFSGEVARTHGEPVDREGPTTNQTNFTGAPHFEGSVTDSSAGVQTSFNGTLAQNIDPHALPPHVSPPAVVVNAKAGVVSGSLGSGPAETFAPSTLIQTSSTRRGLELGLDLKAFSLRAFGNIDDGLPSASGVNEFRQNLYGVSLMPHLGTDRIKFRVLYQYVEDVRDPLYRVPPAQLPNFGDAGAGAPGLGAAGTQPPVQPAYFGSAPKKGNLLSFQAEFGLVPAIGAVLKAEAVRSEFTNDTSKDPLAADWAYALGISLAPAGFSVTAGMRLVSDGFGAPANPALIAGRTIYDGAVSRSFGALSLSANYAHTGDSGAAGSAVSGFSTPVGRADALALTASYSFAASHTSLSVSAQQNSAESAGSTNKATNVNVSIAQPVGAFQFSLGLIGGQQTTEGLTTSEAETRGATLGLSRQGGILSIQTSGGVNQSKNRLTGDLTTSWNAMLTPDVALFNRSVNLTPLGSYSRQVTSAHTGDSDSWSWGGRLTLRTWGSWRGFAIWSQYLETAMASQVEGSPIVRDRRFGAGLAVLFGGGSLGSSVAQQMVSPQLGIH
ncbi:MAG: hypothetical protein PT977_13960 [Acidobacteriota bacterium]|nr:hypothetical protein [Acidobacteriota bacterium]